MTKRNLIAWLMVCLFLLILGYVLFEITNITQVEAESTNFRIWFWENRATDLIVQVALLFAGVLGVTIILDSGKRNS